MSNPKAILLTTLRNYSCLTTGDSIMVAFNNKKYYIEIGTTDKCIFLLQLGDNTKELLWYRDEHRDRDYRKRSCSRSWDRYDRDRYSGRERDHRRRSISRSPSPDHHEHSGRGRYDEERCSRSQSYGRASPAQHSPNSKRALSPHKTHRGESPVGRNPNEHSPALKIVSPHGQRSVSPSPSPHRSNAHEA